MTSTLRLNLITTFAQFAMILVLGATFGPSARGADTPQPPGLTNGQIEKIVHVANDGEIKQAKLAERNSNSASVKDFARMMIRQHEAANRKIAAVVRSQRIRMENSDAANAVAQAADETYARLHDLKGAAFDRAYADAQVKTHEKVLQSIDTRLLPDAENAKLHAAISDIRSTVQMHLDHAKGLQASLEPGTTGAPAMGSG